MRNFLVKKIVFIYTEAVDRDSILKVRLQNG